MPDPDRPEPEAWIAAVKSAIERIEGECVLVGHSLGADMTFSVASALQPMKIPVALILSFDPTGKGPVPGNVKKTLNFYTGGENLWSPVLPAPGFKGELANINLRQGETALKDELNNAIKTIRSNGVYDTVMKKYFSFDVYGG